MDIIKAGFKEKFMAIRLHCMSQCLFSAHAGAHIASEKEIRAVVKQLYGKAGFGTQHFLSSDSTAEAPIRTHAYCNTKSAKCIFINHSDVNSSTVEMLYTGKIVFINSHMILFSYLVCNMHSEDICSEGTSSSYQMDMSK